MIAALKLALKTVLNNYEYRLAISKNFYEKKFDYIKSNLTYLIGYTIYGGTIASMVGMGGGMVVTPIMFSINADPKVTVNLF
jgi:hypothetical protein